MSEIEAETDAPRPEAAWDQFCDALKRAGSIPARPDAPNTPIDRAEGYRYLTQQLAHAILTVLGGSDPERPHLELLSDRVRKWGTLCSDAKAHVAPLRGDLSYRVRGHRGSAHYVSFQVVSGAAGVESIDLDGMEIAEDGRFELVLSALEQPGNWLRLPSDATSLIVRQYFYAWEQEQVARFTIEPVDEVGPPLPLTPSRLAEQLAKIASEFASRSETLLDQVTTHLQPNTLGDPMLMESEGGGRGTYYGLGYFRISADEALILEIERPEAHYWSVQLGNFWHEELDYENHISSLNGRQARLDRDDVFRAVIALDDPGAPNWLDPVGHLEGRIICRYLGATAPPSATLRRVPVDEIWDQLPADTARVDAASRRGQIRIRREHVARRFA